MALLGARLRALSVVPSSMPPVHPGDPRCATSRRLPCDRAWTARLSFPNTREPTHQRGARTGRSRGPAWTADAPRRCLQRPSTVQWLGSGRPSRPSPGRGTRPIAACWLSRSVSRGNSRPPRDSPPRSADSSPSPDPSPLPWKARSTAQRQPSTRRHPRQATSGPAAARCGQSRSLVCRECCSRGLHWSTDRRPRKSTCAPQSRRWRSAVLDQWRGWPVVCCSMTDCQTYLLRQAMEQGLRLQALWAPIRAEEDHDQTVGGL
eukprot:scaffold110_cov247-Pinguiococcus_pyrenoidosus.AAC.6